ncbi:FxsA family protein [Vallicoccus soli]|uniref:FxsA family protein n=1 Tax=Vallicoccus soli TaxID=2339232 RepID=A0A3A3ZDF7_9ACTN|nr:FxsA family protein [Vallicoccus soli]RJK93162.1 FxsA family protein [Vallicoccus soli]
MPAVLTLLFLVVPLVEVYLIVQVGQAVGAWTTVALLLAISALGAWVVRREGRRAWRGLQAALRGGRAPERELADGAMVLVGGTLLLTPGFLTDAVGVLLVLPPTRALLRGALLRWLARRALRAAGLPPEAARAFGIGGRRRGGTGAGGAHAGPWGARPGSRERVVPGEVVEGEVVDRPSREPGER